MIYRSGFFIFLFFSLCVAVHAESDFEARAVSIFDRVSANFSLSSVSLDYDPVVDGSAEARYFPFKGYFIRLDVDELYNATDYELEGMFAHELAHIEKYVSMSKLSLLLCGFHYQFSARFKRQVEYETDREAIANGFGLQLAAFRDYRLRTGSDSDVLILERYYMSPDDIRYILDRQ